MAQTAGVKPMAIAGRVALERERCLGMTDVERSWRQQWLKDQILAPNEPVYVEEYWRERTNIFRRIYRAPLDKIFAALTPMLGASRAADYRYLTGKFALIGFGILCTHYYFKYNGNGTGLGMHGVMENVRNKEAFTQQHGPFWAEMMLDWTKKGGWRVHVSKPMVLPGQPGFPFISKRKPADYANRGFNNATI